MFKFLIAVIVITLNSVNLFAADVPFPDDKLRALPVHVRYDAKQFNDKAYNFFMRQQAWDEENPYKLLFKGIIFGKTFGVLDDIDTSLEVAVNHLTSTEDLENSKRFLSTLTGYHVSTRIDTASLISDRNRWRGAFMDQFNRILNDLYNDGNIYAIFVKGLLGYDEITDSFSSNNAVQPIAELELAAHHLCLPALKFCGWLYDNRGENNSKYKIKLDIITPTKSSYKSAYFDSLLYLEELIKNPFQQNSSFLSKLTLQKVTPARLPVIDVLDKVKKSINLLNSVLTRNNLPDEVSYYGRVFSKLTEFSGNTRASKPALGNWGKMAVVGCPFVGAVYGIVNLHKGDTTAIVTTVTALPTFLYGIQQALSISPVSNGDEDYVKHEIDLISMYLTLKKNPRFTEDIQMTSNVLALGIDDSWDNQVKRFVGYSKLTLSQMVLKKEGKI